jgi:hypothetical protein
MTSNSYTEETIFRDRRINGIIDMMFAKLVEHFPPEGTDTENDFVFKQIILSGKAAEVIQNPKSQPAKAIIFETSNDDIYEYLFLNLKKIYNCKVIAFKERILFYPQDFYFEIWKAETLNQVEENGIWLQHINDIPEEML